MHLEYLLALVQVGQIDMYLSVESSGTQKSFVEDVGAVGCSQDDNTGVRAEAVHLRKQLVQSALALVVCSHGGSAAACAAHGINLIDEDYAGSLLLGLTEEVANTAGADTHEHLHEIRAGHGEERHVGLACNGFGQQGLTRSRRAYEQGALGNLTSEVGEFLRVLQELHNLLHFLLGRGLSGYVLERHLRLVLPTLLYQTGFGAADIEDSAHCGHPTAHIPHYQHPNQDDEKQRGQIPEYLHESAVALLIRELTREVFQLLLLCDKFIQFVGAGVFSLDKRLLASLLHAALEHIAYVFGLHVHPYRAFVLRSHNFIGITQFHELLELGVGDILRCAAAIVVTAVEEQPAQGHGNHHIKPRQIEARHLVAVLVVPVILWFYLFHLNPFTF